MAESDLVPEEEKAASEAEVTDVQSQDTENSVVYAVSENEEIRHRGFFGVVPAVLISVVAILAALFYTGNPIVYRIFSFVIQPSFIAVIIILALYYIWYTGKYRRFLGSKGEVLDRHTVAVKIRFFTSKTVELIKQFFGVTQRYLKPAARFLLKPFRNYIKEFPHRKELRRNTYLAFGFVILLLVGIEVWKITRPVYLAPRDLQNDYSLVRDTVPAEGPLIVKLPAGTDKFFARYDVSFEPDIDVGYARTRSDQHIAFRIKEDLVVGDRYEAIFETKEGEIVRTGFKVVAKPKIQIFEPSKNIVSDEYSTISFLFNRAMIPLESLDREYEPESFPISITPATKGSFVWQSPRQLQFIPESHLHRATTYQVTVSDEFYSVDGLQVDPQEYTFKVKPLSLRSGVYGVVSYKEPITVSFNQPIDIDRSNITVLKRRGEQTTPVAVSVDYASYLTYNEEKEIKERVVDRSKIVILPEKDDLGRDGFWDFDSHFTYEIDAVYSLDGDLNILEPIEKTFNTSKFLLSTTVASPRSTHVNQKIFDPQGTLIYRFAEEIDLTTTVVSGKGVRHTTHAIKTDCSNSVSYDGPCEEIPDRQTLEVHFDEHKLDKGEEFVVSIDTVRGRDGEVFIESPIVTTLKTIPDLAVSKVMPRGGLKEASLTSLYICSNLPLAQIPDEELADYIESTPNVEITRWDRSSLGSYNAQTNRLDCESDEYRTTLHYSLEENTSYDVTFTLKDQFGGRAVRNLAFQTLTLSEVPSSKDNGGFSLLPKPAPLDFYNLHQRYSTTLPDRTTYTLWTENFEEIEVSLCKLSPEDFLRIGGALSQVDTGPTNCLSRETDVIDLPDTKHESHYFQITLADYFDDPRGHYVMSFTHPDYEATFYENGKQVKRQRYEHIYTSVTNLSLVQKNTNRVDLGYDNTKRTYETDLLDKAGNPANLYWVVDLRTLEPVSAADVFVYQYTQRDRGGNRNIRLTNSAQTDSDGTAHTKITADVMGAYVVAGDDTAVVANWSDSLNYGASSREIERMYVYTDRPIYRPGHEVHIKGIHRFGYDGDYAFIEGRSIPVQVNDARGQTLFNETVTLGEFGTFDFTLTVPEDASLGTYSIRAGQGYTVFDVEEYARAPFEVTATPSQDEYISGDTMEVEVDARYFFGVALPKGDVSYTITTQDYYFDRYRDYSFNFNGGAYRCYYCDTHDRFITSGTAELKDGKVTISHELDLNELYDDDEETRSKIFVLRARVQDDRQKAVSTQLSFIVHKADFYAAAKSDSRFIRANSQVPLSVKTVDITGVGKSVPKLQLSVLRKDWQKFKRQEVDGEFYYSWKEVLEEVLVDEISTDASGNANRLITYPKPGEYVISLSGIDTRGNRVFTSSEVYVYGEGLAPVQPSNDRTLELSVEKNDLDVGETAKVIIQSPYTKAKALIGIERGTVMEYDVVDVNSSYFDYDFVVKDEYIPNANMTVLLLSQEPEIKYGTIGFNINRKNRGLTMSVISNKKTYMPGEQVVLDIRTADYRGLPVSAEVSIAAVDMSVLALKGNPTRDLLSYFYTGLPHEVITSSNVKHVHTEIEIPTGSKGGGGNEDLERRKRGVFKDTAFWDASVVTNQSGYAQITFTLPDNLTRWRVESIAVTKDTQVGVHYLEFEERKKLMTIPSVPRFIVPGDIFYIGAQVLNESGSAQDVRISVDSDTLTPLTSPQVTRRVNNSGNELLYFKVQAPHHLETGEHIVTISAENNNLADIVEKRIPIVRNHIKEVVRLADFVSGETALEKIVTPTGIHEDIGGVHISTYATVAAFVEDSLTYMADFPYGCSEQLASKIDTLATIRKLLEIENIGTDLEPGTITFRGRSYTLDQAIADGLTRMYEAQNADGGFGYYRSLNSSYGLTLHIVRTLFSLQEAGYTINDSRLERAIAYVESETKRFKGRGLTVEASVATLENALIVAEQLRHMQPELKAVKNGILTIRDNLSRKTIKSISSSGLARAAILANELGWWDRRTVWKEVDRRLKQDKDGMYLGLYSANVNWHVYETSIKNTAQLLQAMMLQKEPHKANQQVLTWLLAQRYSDGAWGSTNATHAVVETITDYVIWKDEQGADYNLDVSIGDLAAFVYSPQQDGLVHGATTTVPFADLGLGEAYDVTFEKEALRDRRDTFYYDIEMEYYLDREDIPARSEGVDIARNFYKMSDVRRTAPVTEAQLGETLVGVLTFEVGKPAVLFGVEDIIPAGFEIINFDFATEDKALLNELAELEAEEIEKTTPDVWEFMQTKEFAEMEEVIVYRSEKFKPSIVKKAYSRTYNPSFAELHDDRVFLFSERINPGSYKYEYYIRAQTPGEFQHMPATASELYNPVFFGRTAATEFTILPTDSR